MSDTDLDWLGTELAVGEIVRRLTRLFKAHDFWGASQDARALVGQVMRLDFSELVLRAEIRASATERAEIARLVRRRLAFEPVGRILGERDFMGLALQVSDATLEPREDTEIVVEAALGFLKEAQIARPVVADLGTGTGAILIALLAKRLDCLGVAIDISADALATACRNARRHGVADRFLPVVGSYACALRSATFNLIVSNPPYIRSGDIAGLDPDVRDYDPHLALDGGADGLAAYRALAPDSLAALKRDGALIVEIGAEQGVDVTKVLNNAGFANISRLTDRGRRDRVVIARRTTN